MVLAKHAEKSGLANNSIPQRDMDSSASNPPSNDIVIGALQRLRSCHNFELKRLHCSAHSGILILRGQVSSYYLKQLAQEVLRSLNGVHRIANHIEVVYVIMDSCEKDQASGERSQ
jgi:osmotically-inducible protein OsmY